MKKNHFDLVAPFYYTLVKLVFGSKLLKAQLTYLNEISDGDRVLIVGGGNGEILSHVSFSRAAQFDFLELSSKMIDQAKKKATHLDHINFINQDFFQHEGVYDIIICNFFLDCFNEKGLLTALKKLRSLMNLNGQLIVTDFQPSQEKRHQWLLKIMIKFFRLTANLEANQLLDIQSLLSTQFEMKYKKDSCDGLLFSSVFELTPQ